MARQSNSRNATQLKLRITASAHSTVTCKACGIERTKGDPCPGCGTVIGAMRPRIRSRVMHVTNSLYIAPYTRAITPDEQAYLDNGAETYTSDDGRVWF